MLFSDYVYITNIEKGLGVTKTQAKVLFDKASNLMYSNSMKAYNPRPNEVLATKVYEVLGQDRAESRQAYLDSLKLKQLKGGALNDSSTN